jgi:6-phosphogluconolactonase
MRGLVVDVIILRSEYFVLFAVIFSRQPDSDVHIPSSLENLNTMQLKFLSLAVLGTIALTATAATANTSGETVFTSSNETAGNRILAFQDNANGKLTLKYSVPTGGTGTGGGLGNQNAVELSDNKRWLLTVNAGSNDVSVFDTWQGQLKLTDRVSSNGQRPVSVTTQGNLVYVVNATSSNVSGFYLNPYSGKLNPLPNSSRALSAATTGPAQVSFSPNGRFVVVTEKATNTIATFPVNQRGYLGAAQFNKSAGVTPFGFTFNRRGDLFVSEANGGPANPNGSSLSSYDLTYAGKLKAISPVTKDNQTAACWVVLTKNGRYAYVTNTASGTISSFRVNPEGQLNLLQSVSASTGTGSAPIDMAFSNDSKELYVLSGGTSGQIGGFEVKPDGSLKAKPGADGVPRSATGLVVR